MVREIRLFLPNGMEGSIMEAEISNLKGKVLKMSRGDIRNRLNKDIEAIGVYFLFCDSDDGNDDSGRSVYIGESGNVQKRLLQHIQDYNDDKEKFYWNSVVILINPEFDESKVLYLEDYFTQEVKKCARYGVKTQKTRGDVAMNKNTKLVLKDFIADVTVLINILGGNVLKPYVTEGMTKTAVSNKDTDKKQFYIEKRGADAMCIRTDEGFVLLKGSTIRMDMTDSCPPWTKALRENNPNIDKGGIVNKDILFNTPSCAASFVLGSSVSGNIEWQTADGTMLKDCK